MLARVVLAVACSIAAIKYARLKTKPGKKKDSQGGFLVIRCFWEDILMFFFIAFLADVRSIFRFNAGLNIARSGISNFLVIYARMIFSKIQQPCFC